MRLYLIRHGLAVSHNDPSCPPDADRPLTGKGIEKTKEVAAGLVHLGAEPEAFLTSPLVRAVQTAEIVAQEFAFPVGEILEVDALKPGATPSAVFTELVKLKVEEAFCFGHAPTLDEIVAHAVGAKTPFTALKKAGVAVIELDRVSPPSGFLSALYPPRTLRRLAG